MQISDAKHPVARRIADVLKSSSAKPRTFIIDDEENIEQAIRAGITFDSVYVTTTDPDNAEWPLPEADAARYTLTPAVAQDLFGREKRTRLFALAHAPKPTYVKHLAGLEGDIIVLDGVKLVGNIGAITRTACALGAAGVVLLDSGLNNTLDRRLIRASRGLIFATPVISTTREEFLKFIRKEGIGVAALAADAPEELSAIRSVKERLALVFGGEREGVTDTLTDLATHRYSIPMHDAVESLNVSVTAGIALYLRQSRVD